MKQCRSEGIIIPTALFVAMFVLMLATMLVASVSYNLSLSRDSMEATEFRYLSLGAMNELLSDLNAGLDLHTYTKTSPRRTDTGGPIIESWVEPLAGGTAIVVAQTSHSGQVQPESVKSLVSFQEFDTSRVYTNAMDGLPGTVDPIFYSDSSGSGSWDQLPNAPRVRYNANGVLETKPGESAGTILYVTGSPDGSLYAAYSPEVDGWDDEMAPAVFGIPIPVPIPWGMLTRSILMSANHSGLTVGDLTPIEQTLVNHLPDVTPSKGALVLKFSQDTGQWTALPPAPEATVVGGQIQVQSGDFHVQGAPGPFTAYNGGAIGPVFRNGQDTLYRYTESTQQWDVLKPPGEDVVAMTADNQGTAFVQSGNIHDVGLPYFARVLLGDLSDIEPTVSGTSLHKLENGEWSTIPDPPARFFTPSGQQMVDRDYGSRGPHLGGMVASDGELTVVNRPSSAGLVDTLYKFRQGAWEVVPSPPNKHFDASTGHEVTEPGLAPKLEIGMGSEGNLILRVPMLGGPNPIFVGTKGGSYDLLPPVRKEGGPMQGWLSQTAGGRQRDANGRGSFVVRATYF